MNRGLFLKNAALLCSASRLGASSVVAWQESNGNPSSAAQKLAAVGATLRRNVLDVWFPLAVDNDNGGFRSDFMR